MAVSSRLFAIPLRTSLRGACCLAGALLAWLPTGVSAHQVWIEQDAQGARLHFGEYGMNLKEASPGYLDKLKEPTAWLRSPSGKRALTLAKRSRGLHFANKAGPGQALIVEGRTYPLLEGHGDKPKSTRWTPAARYVSDLSLQTTPELTLDILPTEKPGEFQIFFRNQPLSGSEVTLTAANGWVLQATSNDSGKVQFRLPWRSGYVVHTRHREDKPGERTIAKGKKEAFDSASFSTSLSFDIRAGLTPPPRPVAKPPNKIEASNPRS